ncbi:MAG: hypothetical protein KY468_16255 [Armatimonadetes bacterium]|nr:hypothetical protein [Armatimonadota bacterium]
MNAPLMEPPPQRRETSRPRRAWRLRYRSPYRHACITPGCVGRWRMQDLQYGFCPHCWPAVAYYARWSRVIRIHFFAVVVTLLIIGVQKLGALVHPLSHGGPR